MLRKIVATLFCLMMIGSSAFVGMNLVYNAGAVIYGDVETDWAPQVTCGAYDDICYWDGTTFVHYIFSGTVMELTPGRGYYVWSDTNTVLIY